MHFIKVNAKSCRPLGTMFCHLLMSYDKTGDCFKASSHSVANRPVNM